MFQRGPNRGRVGQTGAEQSSCSEGSLLSAGSSDPEDEFRSSKGDLTSSLPSALLSVSSVPDSSGKFPILSQMKYKINSFVLLECINKMMIVFQTKMQKNPRLVWPP